MRSVCSVAPAQDGQERVSRKQAFLFAKQGKLAVEDQRSANGTYVRALRDSKSADVRFRKWFHRKTLSEGDCWRPQVNDTKLEPFLRFELSKNDVVAFGGPLQASRADNAFSPLRSKR